MSIDKEQFKAAVRPNPTDRVELVVGGFKHIHELSVLWGFLDLMLTNVVWSPDSSGGVLEIPRFYDRDLRDAILPNFLEGDDGKKMLGILDLNFYITNNDWSYRHRPTGYHSSDGDSVADTFYNARLKLKIADRVTDFNLVNFYGDTRETGSREDGYIDTMRKGDLYDAVYILSVIPEETWKVIEDTGKTSYSFAAYRLEKRGDGVIEVTPDRRKDDKKVAPIIVVNRPRVGASDVRLGKLDSKKKGR